MYGRNSPGTMPLDPEPSSRNAVKMRTKMIHQSTVHIILSDIDQSLPQETIVKVSSMDYAPGLDANLEIRHVGRPQVLTPAVNPLQSLAASSRREIRW
jgi:hypothetical protein